MVPALRVLEAPGGDHVCPLSLSSRSPGLSIGGSRRGWARWTASWAEGWSRAR